MANELERRVQKLERHVAMLETLFPQIMIFALANRALTLAMKPEGVTVEEAAAALLKDDPALGRSSSMPAIEAEIAKLLRVSQ